MEYNFKNFKTAYGKPRFYSRVARLWQLYTTYVVPADYVVRSGYYLCGVYPEPVSEISIDLSRRQSGSEHIMSAMWWANAICVSFAEIPDFAKNRHEILDTLQIHDLFESKIGGDLPDVSERNNAEKDELEYFWANEYFSSLPSVSFREQTLENFQHMQKRDNILGQICYCIDKSDAILRGLAYEQLGRIGRVGNRGFISDDRSIAFTLTDRMTDNWFYGMINRTENCECADFFNHFVAQVFFIVRSRYPGWLKKVKSFEDF